MKKTKLKFLCCNGLVQDKEVLHFNNPDIFF